VAALDLARALKAEMDELGISQRQFARRKALTTTRVSQLLSLLRLPPEVLERVESLRGQPLGERYLTERALRVKYRP
jgi:ParB-like chromosome segregation protein Spo0J